MLFTRKHEILKDSGRSSDLCLTRLTFPSFKCMFVSSILYKDSGQKCCPVIPPSGEGGALTATGIVPDLHRTSLLMAPRANQNLHEYINNSAITLSAHLHRKMALILLTYIALSYV